MGVVVPGLVQVLCFSDSDIAKEDCAVALPAALICSADLRYRVGRIFPQSPLTLPQSRNPLQSSLAVTAGMPYTLRQRSPEMEKRKGEETKRRKKWRTQGKRRKEERKRNQKGSKEMQGEERESIL